MFEGFGDGLPVVDEVLAAALNGQGALGVRALGLLRDARLILAGTGPEWPAEVAKWEWMPLGAPGGEWSPS